MTSTPTLHASAAPRCARVVGAAGVDAGLTLGLVAAGASRRCPHHGIGGDLKTVINPVFAAS